MNRKDLAQVGLKWDPFANEVPLESVYVSPIVESFYWRVEHSLVRDGGYAWIRGDSGNGKSTALRVVEDRLRRVADVAIGSLQRPSSGVADPPTAAARVTKESPCSRELTGAALLVGAERPVPSSST